MEKPRFRTWPLIVPSTQNGLLEKIAEMEESAKNELLKVEQIKKDAYKEGLKLGYEDAFNKAFLALMKEVKKQNDKGKEILSYYSSKLPDLGSELAKKVIGNELVTNEDTILHITKNLLKKIEIKTVVTISVNPKDLDAVRKIKTLSNEDFVENLINIKSDEKITIGDVFISTGAVQIEGTLESFGNEIREFLKEKANGQVN